MMNPQELSARATKILQRLLEKPGMNFQEVVDIVHNRDEALRRIDKLIEMGLVRDLRSEPKKGQVRQLELTSNGEELALKIAANDLNAAWETVKRMMARIAQDPSKIKKWQAARRKAMYALRIYPELSDEQKGQRVREHVLQHQKRWDRPMLECLRLVHEAFLSTSEPPQDVGSLIGITRLDDAYEVKLVPKKQVPEFFPQKRARAKP